MFANFVYCDGFKSMEARFCQNLKFSKLHFTAQNPSLSLFHRPDMTEMDKVIYPLFYIHFYCNLNVLTKEIQLFKVAEFT